MAKAFRQSRELAAPAVIFAGIPGSRVLLKVEDREMLEDKTTA
jgi:hypothetical protein